VLGKLTGAGHRYDRQCRVDELRKGLVAALVETDYAEFDRIAKELRDIAWQEAKAE
jgi:hypothetical protein